MSNNSMTNGVQVIVRVRPLSKNEKKEGTLPVVTCNGERREVAVIKGSGSRQARSAFKFDNVFSLFTTQEEIFERTLLPMIDDVMRGYESTVFAYGQTGTGKTYTMEGDIKNEEKMGVIPRAAAEIFRRLDGERYFDTEVKVSYLEIYNEELGDLLLNPVSRRSGSCIPPPKLQIVEGTKGKGNSKGTGVHCKGLKELNVTCPEDVLKTLTQAQERRRVGETKMNKHSSRSHCMFTISVSTKDNTIDGLTLQRSGRLHMVDLAGSECAKTAGNGSRAREQERANINKSLLSLGRVITTLKKMSVEAAKAESSGRSRKQDVRIPYRDSKLTRLLQESLGGHCKTCIIATVSPSVLSADETLSTLQYAQRAHGIQNKPAIDVRGVFGGGGAMPTDGMSVDSFQAMQTRLAYLEAQVEDAQGALGRKQEMMQEALDKVEGLESRIDGLQEEVEVVTGKLTKEQRQKVRVQQRLSEVQTDASAMGVTCASLLGELTAQIASLAERHVESSAKLGDLIISADGSASEHFAALQAALNEFGRDADAGFSTAEAAMRGRGDTLTAAQHGLVAAQARARAAQLSSVKDAAAGLEVQMRALVGGVEAGDQALSDWVAASQSKLVETATTMQEQEQAQEAQLRDGVLDGTRVGLERARAMLAEQRQRVLDVVEKLASQQSAAAEQRVRLQSAREDSLEHSAEQQRALTQQRAQLSAALDTHRASAATGEEGTRSALQQAQTTNADGLAEQNVRFVAQQQLLQEAQAEQAHGLRDEAQVSALGVARVEAEAGVGAARAMASAHAQAAGDLVGQGARAQLDALRAQNRTLQEQVRAMKDLLEAQREGRQAVVTEVMEGVQALLGQKMHALGESFEAGLSAVRERGTKATDENTEVQQQVQAMEDALEGMQKVQQEKLVEMEQQDKEQIASHTKAMQAEVTEWGQACRHVSDQLSTLHEQSGAMQQHGTALSSALSALHTDATDRANTWGRACDATAEFVDSVLCAQSEALTNETAFEQWSREAHEAIESVHDAMVEVRTTMTATVAAASTANEDADAYVRELERSTAAASEKAVRMLGESGETRRNALVTARADMERMHTARAPVLESMANEHERAQAQVEAGVRAQEEAQQAQQQALAEAAGGVCEQLSAFQAEQTAHQARARARITTMQENATGLISESLEGRKQASKDLGEAIADMQSSTDKSCGLMEAGVQGVGGAVRTCCDNAEAEPVFSEDEEENKNEDEAQEEDEEVQPMSAKVQGVQVPTARAAVQVNP